MEGDHELIVIDGGSSVGTANDARVGISAVDNRLRDFRGTIRFAGNQQASRGLRIGEQIAPPVGKVGTAARCSPA